jgi:hypothetical protein
MTGSFWRRGSGRSGRRHAAGWALTGALVLGPVLLLAACGSIQASGSSGAAGASPGPSSSASAGTPAAQAALCQEAGSVTSMEIVRTAGARIPQEMQNAMPDRLTVSQPASAQQVARALCDLPKMPKGPVHCPALFIGTTYHLIFTANGRQLPTVTIEATGCQTVTGVGAVRRASTSPAFWRVLDLAAGKPARGPSVFSGGAPTCQPPSTQTSQHNGCPGVAQPGGVSQPGGVT